MDNETKQKLKDKLIDTVGYTQKLKNEKKAFLGSCNEQIREAEKRIQAYSGCLKNGDLTILDSIMDEYELGELLGRKMLIEE